ncbi:uncharacterized protein I206_106598 [Kwoniella pini CBS 10737]|uniref:Uncharacterized protein n=1 Tax=Kwoniella pini CBS 10737 TaxID=1296096 RepID=A0A1B9HTQ8_9TREE|nr:uncharacterized protein I206_07511 [Kwoniella pini CBS 10737]OCF46658.1 hypothetical protein I206_07511 [Kwoniella pini CBS 10737]
MAPPTPLSPTLTFALPPLPLIPTSPPLSLPILDKRQTYVTLSVTKNSTDDSSSNTSSSSGFPIKIAIPALIGGMALALAGFGIWLWWTRKVKRERREAWEARQRRKRRQQQNQSGRPSVSSSTRTPPSSGKKSPINEKGFIPPVPALPKHAATQDPYKERGYGYSELSQPPQQLNQVENGGGAFGYSTQPTLDQQQYSYDQYGQPLLQQQQQEQQQGYDPRQVYGHSRAKSNDSSNPSNPFSSTNSAVPDLPPSQEESSKISSPAPPRNEKSSKRAQARMNLADSAAANASVDPNLRHQPKKPSPLALAKAAEAAQYNHDQKMEHLAPPNNLPSYSSGGNIDNSIGGNRATSGEWGVALGSPNNDGNFSTNVQANQNQRYSISQDPYAPDNQRGKSGMYAQDPYAAYHGNVDEGDQDDDVYHKAAEGMGLGNGGNNTPKKSSRWV